ADALRTLEGDVGVKEYLAAISMGIVDGKPLLDLCYTEDSAAQVDCNLVMTDSGKIVEVQGTAEGNPFTRDELNRLMDLAEKGVSELTNLQKSLLMQDLTKKFGGK